MLGKTGVSNSQPLSPRCCNRFIFSWWFRYDISWLEPYDRKWLGGGSRSEDVPCNGCWLAPGWVPSRVCVTRGEPQSCRNDPQCCMLSFSGRFKWLQGGFVCLFKQVPCLCAWRTTAVPLASFFILLINRTSREKICVFLGPFLPVWFYDRHIASAFEARACDVEQSRCVSFISSNLSCD